MSVLFFKSNRVKEITLSSICIFALFFIAFIFSLTARSQPLTVLESYTDSSVFQYIARVMLNGGMPYRDTFDHKGPFLYCLNALALWISSDKGLWLIELTTLFFSFLLIYKLSRLFCRKLVSVCVVIAILPILNQYFDGGNLTEEYALPFIVGAIYIFTDFFLNKKISRLRLILCGASLGIVLMIRVNMIAVWMVMCIGVLIYCIYNREVKRLLGFLIFFMIGLLVAVAPFIIWLALNGALQSFWNNYIIFNFAYSSDEQRANIFSKICSFIYFFNEPLVHIGCGVLAVYFFKKRKLLSSLLLLCLLATLLLICISGQTYNHYGMIIIPTLIVPLAYIGKACEKSFGKEQLCTVFLAIYLLVTLVLPTCKELTNNAVVSLHNRGTENIDATSLAVSSWVEENTEEHEPIIVCGNWDFIYNRSNRFAASKYSYQSPIGSIDSNIEKEFFEELSQNKPAVIVLPIDFFAKNEMIEFINTNDYIRAYADNVGDNIELYILK